MESLRSLQGVVFGMSSRGRDGKGGGELWELFRLFTKLGFVAFGLLNLADRGEEDARRNPARRVEIPAQQVLAPRRLSPDQRYVLKNLVERETNLRSEATTPRCLLAGESSRRPDGSDARISTPRF